LFDFGAIHGSFFFSGSQQSDARLSLRFAGRIIKRKGVESFAWERDRATIPASLRPPNNNAANLLATAAATAAATATTTASSTSSSSSSPSTTVGSVARDLDMRNVRRRSGESLSRSTSSTSHNSDHDTRGDRSGSGGGGGGGGSSGREELHDDDDNGDRDDDDDDGDERDDRNELQDLIETFDGERDGEGEGDEDDNEGDDDDNGAISGDVRTPPPPPPSSSSSSARRSLKSLIRAHDHEMDAALAASLVAADTPHLSHSRSKRHRHLS